MNLAPKISPAALPSTPATEWAKTTNDMLASAHGIEIQSPAPTDALAAAQAPEIQTPGPHVPGAFPMDSPNEVSWAASTHGGGETLIERAKAHLPQTLSGYFGVASVHGDASQTESMYTASLSADSPDSAHEIPLSSTSPLAIFAGSTQSLGVSADAHQNLGLLAGSTPSLASTAAVENAPHSPNIPPAPHPTPILGSTSPNPGARDAARRYLDAALIPMPGAPSAPPGSGFVSDNYSPKISEEDSAAPPFTPSPVPVTVPAGPADTTENYSTKANGNTNPLLTHAGTHARGHTDAEEAQRAKFAHGHAYAVPSPTLTSTTATATNQTVIANPAMEIAAAAAGHIFTAQGVHAGTTLGAARVAHAGAFVHEGGSEFQNNTGVENGDNGEEEREGKCGSKASRFVARLKGKMHVG
ncbi:hypothetical protein B0H19DRAFT_1278843 [Mycena capillaripes]|nr:hypothetical protein B0H19DRAFT_1278843 [Mycena capillaripes]